MTDIAWKPTPGRDAMTRDGRRVTGLRKNVGGTDENRNAIEGILADEPISWASDGRHCWNTGCPDDLVRDADPLPAEADAPAIPSPVRQRTVTEIVPGVYGAVEVGFHDDKAKMVFVRLERDAFAASELRAAASTLTQIADAMEAGE